MYVRVTLLHQKPKNYRGASRLSKSFINFTLLLLVTYHLGNTLQKIESYEHV